MRQAFADGIAWGEAKRELFELVNEQLGEARERYNELMEKPQYVEDVLQSGAAKARAYSEPMLEKLRAAVGIRPLGESSKTCLSVLPFKYSSCAQRSAWHTFP